MKNKKSLETITFFDYPSTLNEGYGSSIADFPQETTDELLDIQITEHILGEGGMGIVYEGVQRFPKRPIAIKRLKKRHRLLEEFLCREAMITGRLAHPNIIPVHSLRPHQEHGPEVVMPLLKGKTLLDVLNNKSMPLRDILFVLDNVCNGLHYAHEHNIIHRDIKPENIIIGFYGEVYLVDWGIAIDKEDRATHKYRMVGTPAYMPPEMISGDPNDVCVQTDIYLLGATLHHVLMGEPRHQGENLEEILAHIQHSKEHQYPNHIFSELGSLANQCCHVYPSQRPSTVSEFQRKLHESIAHWDVLKLIAQGEESLQRLFDTSSTQEAYPVYMETRGLFLQAKKSWPQSISPQKGLTEALEYMIQGFIKDGVYKTAQSLCSELSTHEPTHPQLSTYRKQIQHLEVDFLRLKNEARDHDLSISRKSRIRIAQILTSMAVLGTGYVCWEIIFLQKQNNYTLLLWTMLAPTCSVLVCLFFWSRPLLYNKASRVAFINVFATMLCILANRTIGILYEEEINRIITTDIFIIALYWAHMTTQSKKASVALIATLFFGFWSIGYPQHAFWMLNLAILSSTSITAYFWVRGEI